MALVGLYYITNRKLLKESLERIVRENIRTNGEYQLTDALRLMIEAGEKMSALAVEGWYDCGKPETLLETNRYLLENKNNTPSYDNTIIVPPVFIDPSAKIINSIIGPYATVGANAELEHVIIENTIVGANAEIKKVILKDSIIGTNSVIIGSHKKMNSGDSTEIEFN
jgi:glucose-1-phosphate thymidylyltransferase